MTPPEIQSLLGSPPEWLVEQEREFRQDRRRRQRRHADQFGVAQVEELRARYRLAQRSEVLAFTLGAACMAACAAGVALLVWWLA